MFLRWFYDEFHASGGTANKQHYAKDSRVLPEFVEHKIKSNMESLNLLVR